jgi:hypothetical protein
MATHFKCRQAFVVGRASHSKCSQSFYLVTAYHNVVHSSHTIKLSYQIIGCAYPVTRLYTCLIVNTTYYVNMKRHMVCCKKHVITTSILLYQQPAHSTLHYGFDKWSPTTGCVTSACGVIAGAFKTSMRQS